MENRKLFKDSNNSNVLVCVTYDENGNELSRKNLELYDSEGKVIPETLNVITETISMNNNSKDIIEEDKDIVVPEGENLNDDFDLDASIEKDLKAEKEEEEFEIEEEYKAQDAKKLSKKGKFLVASLFLLGAAYAVSKFESCSTKEPVSIENNIDNEKDDTVIKTIVEDNQGFENTNVDNTQIENNEATENTENKTEEVVEEELPTLEELKSDSRYTEITEENLVKTTQDLINEFSQYGIELNGEDALTFVTVANMTHLEQTNQELLSKVLGMDANKETTLSKVGHIIGQVVTLEITDKDQQVDWTIALMNETDKNIAKHGMNVISEAKTIGLNKELTEKEKEEQIQALIQDKFVKPNYDKTVGYDFEDGTHTSLSQEDGADFISDAIFTGIVLGDNLIKNYVYGSETMDDMLAISKNEDVVSNLMTMIENCNLEEEKAMSR